MKRCPRCNHIELDDALGFCRLDGTALISDSAQLGGDGATVDLEVNSEIETSLLPNAPGLRSTGPTTALPTGAAFTGTKELRQPKRWLVIAIAFVVLAVVATVGYFYFDNRSAAGIQAIAVMPFINESGNPELEYLSDGMTENLINSLSSVPNLNVKSRSSVFRYKGKDLNAKQIASDLSVQALLVGRVSQRGGQLILNLELLEAKTENLLWGEKYERQPTDVTSLQSEVARDVSNKLRTRLSGADEAKIAKKATTNEEAYQHYLKGLFHWHKRTPEALKKSVEYFSEALAKDPSYAEAYAGLASAYVLFPEYSISTPREAMPKAKAMARKAIELDDTLAEAHTALGYALLTFDRDYEGSSREFKRAMTVNPNYATAYQWYTDGYLLPKLQFDEAQRTMRKALELDPFSLVVNAQLGLCYLYERDYDQAMAQFRKTSELDPNWYLAHWFMGITHELKGNLNEALAEYQRARELNDDPYLLAYLVHVNAAMGNRAEAVQGLGQMAEVAKHRYVPAYAFAIAHAGLGNKQEALNWLEQSEEDRAWDILHVKSEPFFDHLRSEARFVKLIERIGL